MYQLITNTNSLWLLFLFSAVNQLVKRLKNYFTFQQKQEELQSCSLWNENHIHRKIDKDITEEIKKYIETNDNENTMTQTYGMQQKQF